MARLPVLAWKEVLCVFKQDGFVFKKRSGKGTSHWIGEKPGVPRPIVVPEYDEVGLDILTGNMRTAGMPRKRFLELLENC